MPRAGHCIQRVPQLVGLVARGTVVQTAHPPDMRMSYKRAIATATERSGLGFGGPFCHLALCPLSSALFRCVVKGPRGAISKDLDLNEDTGDRRPKTEERV
jgi:hypothetical protein